MPRPHSGSAYREEGGLSAGLHANSELRNPQLDCSHCEHTLECVEQSRRSGTWLGSFICPNCRSEYFYAYRWSRLMRKS